jgi:hypothetical protein
VYINRYFADMTMKNPFYYFNRIIFKQHI